MEGSTPQTYSRKLKRRFKFRLTKRRKIVLALFCVALAGVFIYFFAFLQNKEVVRNDQCSTREIQDTLFKDAAIVIPGNKADEMSKIVDNVQKIPGYENDQNCLYPIVKFHLLVGNSARAREAYDKLASVYLADKGFLPVFGPNTDQPDELRVLVETSEKQKKEIDDSGFYGVDVQ